MYGAVSALAKKAVAVSRACQVLEVSRAGYYALRRRRPDPLKQAKQQTYVRAAFERSGRSYGSRRIAQDVSKMGVKIGRHRARTLMR